MKELLKDLLGNGICLALIFGLPILIVNVCPPLAWCIIWVGGIGLACTILYFAGACVCVLADIIRSWYD